MLQKYSLHTIALAASKSAPPLTAHFALDTAPQHDYH
jgi:hypothetical protein